jgi:hypothetical protein
MISNNTKGITCFRSKEDIQISKRYIRVWIMVSKKEGSITYFLDVDWEGCSDDQRSTSGATFYLDECLVSWLSKK